MKTQQHLDYSRPGSCLWCGIRYYCPEIFDHGYCSSTCERADDYAEVWR